MCVCVCAARVRACVREWVGARGCVWTDGRVQAIRLRPGDAEHSFLRASAGDQPQKLSSYDLWLGFGLEIELGFGLG